MTKTDASPTEMRTDPSGLRDWIARRWFTPSGALVAELQPGVEAEKVFRRLARRRHCLFLDSAAPDGGRPAVDSSAPAPPRLGRHSFIAVDPIHSIRIDPGRELDAAAAFAAVRALLKDLACPTIPGLPPFQGGVAGLVSYECGLARLGIRAAAVHDIVPLLSLHVYDVVWAFDHDAGRAWIVSQGIPARGPVARRGRAAERLEAILEAADAPTHAAPSSHQPAPAGRHAVAEHTLPGVGAVVSTQSRSSYIDMVRSCIELVRAGDIFQANLAQELAVATGIDPVELHLRGRSLNAAPFAGFFDAGPAAVVSMSPERLLQVDRGTVRMHPIKGTRRVLARPEADLYAGEELGASDKDRAENVMIVDLVRNDLSRVCTPQSVRVEALCRLERYRYVQHLVSIVSGRLRPGCTALDALEAAIPGGSVTGAPKHRACEIIEAMEGFRRGAYCGSLGYLGLDGAADFNLLIRSFVVTPDSIRFAVGGGITARSDPAAEYAETLHKAEGMLRVLASFGDVAARSAAEAPP